MPIKPIKPGEIETFLPDEGEIKMREGVKYNIEKEMFAEILKDIAKKDERIKDLLKDNDYEILDVIKSKPIVKQTETSETTKVKTATVVLEKESTGKKYWITIDLEANSVKSIKSE